MIADDELAAAVLVSLPNASATRLRALLTEYGSAMAVVEAVQARAPEIVDRFGGDLVDGWRDRVRDLTADVAATMASRGTRALTSDRPDWPVRSDHPSMPRLLLAEGVAFESLFRPRVAVVGTRRPSPHGAADAREVAESLARGGICVVSGLANGIDGAAHRGALDVGGLTIGVTATGLDVVYPASHRGLWHDVRAGGLIVSEQPFGTPPRREYFPIRNRIIVGMVDAVIIVEAAIKGGAMRTAQIALDLGVAVYALPGSRRNPMAEGCNRLIAEGATPMTDPLDVLAFVSGVNDRAERRPTLAGLSKTARAVYRALHGEPATLDQVVARCGLLVATVAGATRELDRLGRVRRHGGRLWPM